MPEEDREEQIDRSTRPPMDPPTYEETLHSLGRAPTIADLGPHSPGSCSSSLVPYEAGEDSNPEDDQNSQERAPEQMETEEPAMVETPTKEGMGIAVGPEEYTPASPRYVRDGEDDTDDQDTDGDEDVEAPFLAPKGNPTSKTPRDEQTAHTPLKGNTTPAEDPQASSSEESIPELIDLREEEGVPPKRINHPTTLGLNKKMAVMAKKTPIPPSPFPKGNAMTLPVAAPEVNIEADMPEEQIIYLDDDTDPSPLSLLKRQVDHLLMPPPTDTTPLCREPLCHQEEINNPQGAREEKTSTRHC